MAARSYSVMNNVLAICPGSLCKYSTGKNIEMHFGQESIEGCSGRGEDRRIRFQKFSYEPAPAQDERICSGRKLKRTSRVHLVFSQLPHPDDLF